MQKEICEVIDMKLYYKIKNYWNDFRTHCERFKRGYAYIDVWDMDCWFVHTVKPMLMHLRDHGIGYPSEFKSRIYWENILTEMISCLDLMNEDVARADLCISSNDYSHKSYQKVNEFIEANKNRFFELFSKYFFSLWD